MRALAEEFGTTAGSICKRVKKHQWVQDKSEEVRRKTRAALLKETDEGNRNRNTPSHEDIENAVQTNITVITGHRKSIREGHAIVDLLHSQLDFAAAQRDQIQETIETETARDETTARRTAMMKAVSLPAHAGVLRDLSQALKNLIPLERQAFNIDEDSGRIDQIKRIVVEMVDPQQRDE